MLGTAMGTASSPVSTATGSRPERRRTRRSWCWCADALHGGAPEPRREMRIMKQRTGADVARPDKPEPSPRPRLRTTWALGLLLVACLAAYANVWRGEFVADDMTLREHVASQSRLSGWFDLFRHDLYHSENGVRSGFYRPLAALSLLVDGAVYGARPAGYHATNVFLHVVATWLVLGLGLAFGLAAPV